MRDGYTFWKAIEQWIYGQEPKPNDKLMEGQQIMEGQQKEKDGGGLENE